MGPKEGKQDYLQFMQWFQNHYPDLYMEHGQSITVPVDGEGVTVLKDGMSQNVYQTIIDITKMYYQQEIKY